MKIIEQIAKFALEESTVTALGEQATAPIVVLENTKTLRPTTFKILKQALVVQIIITIIANGDVKPGSQ